MTGTILVLTALDSELDNARAPDGVAVVYTGLGKVNAARVTSDAVLRLKPALVVNYGTAGKINPALRGLVEVADVVQRDMLPGPLAPRGQTPFSTDPVRFASGSGAVVCGTGDSFVMETDPWLRDNGVDIVDMELFAIAHVCHHHAIPWRAFKFITDDANDFAADHWTANIADGQTLFWDAMKTLQL